MEKNLLSLPGIERVDVLTQQDRQSLQCIRKDISCHSFASEITFVGVAALLNAARIYIRGDNGGQTAHNRTALSYVL